MLKNFALAISVVFQPLLMPTLVYGLILYVVPEATSIPTPFKSKLYFLVVVASLIVPMLLIIGFRLSGLVRSLHMKDIKDRLIPFAFTSLFYAMMTYLLATRYETSPIFWQVLALITSVIAGLTVVTIFWKMSAHMTGIGGVLALILMLGIKFPNFQVMEPLLLCLVLVGIIGSSRLYLNAHRPLEIYIGFLYGFFACWFGFNLIWV